MLILWVKALVGIILNCLAGFMSFKSLMRGKEVVADVWPAITRGGGKQILMQLVMEVHLVMIRLVVIC